MSCVRIMEPLPLKRSAGIQLMGGAAQGSWVWEGVDWCCPHFDAMLEAAAHKQQSSSLIFDVFLMPPSPPELLQL